MTKALIVEQGSYLRVIRSSSDSESGITQKNSYSEFFSFSHPMSYTCTVHPLLLLRVERFLRDRVRITEKLRITPEVSAPAREWRRCHYDNDGCDMGHDFVLEPCRVCGKAPASWRHDCKYIQAGERCSTGKHHRFVYAEEGLAMATRDGCREHGVGRDEVEQRWERSEAADADSSVCACCLGPSRIGFDYCRKCSQEAA